MLQRRRAVYASFQRVCAAGAPLDAATLAGFIAGQDMDAVFLQSFASRAHGTLHCYSGCRVLCSFCTPPQCRSFVCRDFHKAASIHIACLIKLSVGQGVYTSH